MGKGHGNYVCVSQPINHLITSTTLPVWNPLIQYMGINCMMQDLFSLYFLVVDGEHVKLSINYFTAVQSIFDEVCAP